jgi:hypothetical protein
MGILEADILHSERKVKPKSTYNVFIQMNITKYVNHKCTTFQQIYLLSNTLGPAPRKCAITISKKEFSD